MKKIKQKLPVGTPMQGLDLYCSLKMDGEEITRFRSESFVLPFAYLLEGLFNGGVGQQRFNYSNRAWETWDALGDGNSEVESQTSTTPVVLTLAGGSPGVLDNFNDYGNENPNWIIINNAEKNGLYRGVATGGDSFELYELDGTPVDGSLYDFVGAHVTCSWRLVERAYTDHGSFTYYHSWWQNWNVIVGKSDRPVSINDIYLWDRILDDSEDSTLLRDQTLSHGAKSVSVVGTDKPTSKFTISKPFTNTGTDTVEVREIGITTGTTANRGRLGAPIMVRDILGSPLSVPANSTLTVDYELVIRLTPDTQDTDTDGTNGGFLAVFMERIRDFALSYGQGKAEYFLCGTSPGATNYGDDTYFNPSEFGIRLGDDNQFTSMTDTKLNLNDVNKNGYEHGSADGQLYHYGTDVSPVVVDEANNKATFQVSRIFENRGSTPVTVREIGLFANIDPDTNRNPLNAGLIARTALAPADQFTIAAGEFKQVVYEVEVKA